MPPKKPKFKLGQKNLAMLPSYFDYILVHLRQKSTYQARIKPKNLSTLGPKRTRKARPDLQLCSGNFLPFRFHFIQKIFSLIQSILPYQTKFRLKATRNLYCTFATLSESLQDIVDCKVKLYVTIMHLIPYLKHYRNELPQTFIQTT